MTRHRTVRSTDGVRIQLHDLGGDGPPLLIAHATGFHGLAYQPLAVPLTDRFHVWALDFRGHGGSTPPAHGDFGWNGMADDFLACADAIGARELHAFGHSLGGATILLAELARPGLIAGAYLFEPIVFPEDVVGGESVMSQAARRRRRDFPSRAEAMLRYASKPPLGWLRADALAAYVQHGFVDRPGGGVRLACLPENEARTFESEEKMTVDRVKGLTVPVVVGVGQDEPGPNPAAMAPDLVAALANARLIRYEHLGHFGPLQAPERIAGDVLAAFA